MRNEGKSCLRNFESPYTKKPRKYNIRRKNISSNYPRKIFSNITKNKERFIDLFANKLNEAGIKVVRATDDADVPIIKEAIFLSENFKQNTIVMYSGSRHRSSMHIISKCLQYHKYPAFQRRTRHCTIKIF